MPMSKPVKDSEGDERPLEGRKKVRKFIYIRAIANKRPPHVKRQPFTIARHGDTFFGRANAVKHARHVEDLYDHKIWVFLLRAGNEYEIAEFEAMIDDGLCDVD